MKSHKKSLKMRLIYGTMNSIVAFLNYFQKQGTTSIFDIFSIPTTNNTFKLSLTISFIAYKNCRQTCNYGKNMYLIKNNLDIYQ